MASEMIGDQVTIALFIALTILSYVIGIIQLYGYITFHKMQHLMIILKRYPMIVKMKAIGVMIHCFLSLPMRIGYYIIATRVGLHHAIKEMQFTAALLSLSTLYLIIGLEAARLWLISYDLNYLRANQNKEWKSQIDHSPSNQDWYIHNRNKWGNAKHIVRAAFVYCVTVSILSAISHIALPHGVARLVSNLFYLIPVCGIVYIFYKCPKALNDNFLFQYEFKRIIFMSLTAFVFSLINIVFRNLEVWTLYFITQSLLSFYALFMPSFLSTIWIIRKVNQNESWQSLTENMLLRVHSSNSHTDRENTIDEQMQKVFVDENEFELFVLWMYREFSAESILSFIEFVQFEECLMSSCSDAIPGKYVLYGTVPKSFIVFKCAKQLPNYDIVCKTEPSNQQLMCGNTAHLLFVKYIEMGATLEINISWELRHRFIEMDEQLWARNRNDVMEVFVAATDEMYFFMRDSFVRYLAANQN
eukprot:556849_1